MVQEMEHLNQKIDQENEKQKLKRLLNLIKTAECPPEKKQIYIPLDKTVYLYLSVARKRTKSFVYRRKVNGTWNEQHLGKFAGGLDGKPVLDSIADVLKDAMDKTAAFTKAKREGSPNPMSVVRQNAAKEKTLQDLFDHYMTEHVIQRRKQIKEPRENFDRWLGSIASRNASAITREMARKLKDKIRDGRGLYAANRAVQLARAVYYRAMRDQIYSGENPFAFLTLFAEKPRKRVLTNHEAGRLFKALNAEPDGDLKDFVSLAIMTGARKSNLMEMRWEDVDLQANTWTIPDTKNGDSQIMPLGGNELAILNRRSAQRQSSYVFPGREDKSKPRQDIKKAWTSFRKRINLEDLTIHDLRRSLAATMASQNVNVAIIKSALNHRDMKTTLRVYALTAQEAELAAKEKAHEVWFEAAGLKPDTGKARKQRKASK